MRTELEPALAATAQGAIADSVLRACVHCGMCNATCPTYALTGDELDGPRGRIYLMKGALEGAPATRLTQMHLDRCLSCRACETTCPSGVGYHRLLDIAKPRIDARVRRPWRERLLRFGVRALGLRPWLIRPWFALLGRGKGGRVPAAGVRTMALLKGCVQSAAAPHFNTVTRRVFGKVGIALTETPGTGCCGALAFHTGDEETGRDLARRNIAAWEVALDAGAEAIVANASGCAAFIRDYPDLLVEEPAWRERAARVAAGVRDPVEVLDQVSLEPARAPGRPIIAVHDPCTLRNGLKLEGRVAALLGGLGYRLQAVADAHLCCGSAGAYSILQPTFAKALRLRKIAALTITAPEAIYTANIGCWMHLSGATRTPVRHWIEAVDAVL